MAADSGLRKSDMLTIRQSQFESMADACPGVQMIGPCASDATWIQVCLVDEDQKPVAGEKYQVRLPDSSLMEGALDQDGKVRFDGIMPGEAQVTFPDLDSRVWAASADTQPGA